MQASNLQQEANLISRMERMPLNKALLTLVGLLSWCWVMEAFDLGMIGQVVAVLKKIWDLDASTLGLLGSCSTAGVVIGTASAVFVFDPEPVQNEVANVNTAWEKYNNDLLTGAIDPETTLPTIIDELNAAGLQTVIDEAQKQLDAFFAE